MTTNPDEVPAASVDGLTDGELSQLRHFLSSAEAAEPEATPDRAPLPTRSEPEANARQNERSVAVCTVFGLSPYKASYYVASHNPSDPLGSHVVLGFTDDPKLAVWVAGRLAPSIEGETFTAEVWR